LRSAQKAARAGDAEARDGRPLEELKPAVVIPRAILITQGTSCAVRFTANLDARVEPVENLEVPEQFLFIPDLTVHPFKFCPASWLGMELFQEPHHDLHGIDHRMFLTIRRL